MARYVAVVQIECDEDGNPLLHEGKALIRYGIIDRRRKYKTFFSGRNHKVCLNKASELNKSPAAAEVAVEAGETEESGE